MKRIGVFCSSRSNIRPEFIQSGKDLGRKIGQSGCDLVYGGSRCGLMGIVAEDVRNAGGHIIGAIPRILAEKNLDADVDVAFMCENLDDRKSTMLREADIFVALPGGVGTLDEIFTIVASNTIGYHNKKVILYNISNFWGKLISLLEQLKEEGMIAADIGERLVVANSSEELYEQIF